MEEEDKLEGFWPEERRPFINIYVIKTCLSSLSTYELNDATCSKIRSNVRFLSGLMHVKTNVKIVNRALFYFNVVIHRLWQLLSQFESILTWISSSCQFSSFYFVCTFTGNWHSGLDRTFRTKCLPFGTDSPNPFTSQTSKEPRSMDPLLASTKAFVQFFRSQMPLSWRRFSSRIFGTSVTTESFTMKDKWQERTS